MLLPVLVAFGISAHAQTLEGLPPRKTRWLREDLDAVIETDLTDGDNRRRRRT
jgi:hypothetical protein